MFAATADDDVQASNQFQLKRFPNESIDGKILSHSMDTKSLEFQCRLFSV